MAIPESVSLNQQDFLLHSILDFLCARSTAGDNPAPERQILEAPIFPIPPFVGIESCRCLLRFLGGMEDFGRVNAHQPRWASFPGLRDSDTHKRACLFCWAQSRKVFEDSEWHSVFSCPIGNACRKRFLLALSNSKSLPENSDSPVEILNLPSKYMRLPISSDLARLVIFCRSNGQLAGELARFVVELMFCREKAFAKLTVRDLFPEST